MEHNEGGSKRQHVVGIHPTHDLGLSGQQRQSFLPLKKRGGGQLLLTPVVVVDSPQSRREDLSSALPCYLCFLIILWYLCWAQEYYTISVQLTDLLDKSTEIWSCGEPVLQSWGNTCLLDTVNSVEVLWSHDVSPFYSIPAVYKPDFSWIPSPHHEALVWKHPLKPLVS